MSVLSTLKVKIFADGADKAGMLEMYRNPLISGFTTNPTLMRKAGVSDYREFALDILRAIRSFDPCLPCAVHLDTGRGTVVRDATTCACGWEPGGGDARRKPDG